jgi:hypothetical protein
LKNAHCYVNDTGVNECLSEYNLTDIISNAYRSDGKDIVVTDINGNLIPREIVIFDKGTSKLQIHLKDPAISTTSGGTELFLQCGGNLVNVANDVNVWSGIGTQNGHYEIVSHCSETSGALILNSSGYHVGIGTGLVYSQLMVLHNGLKIVDTTGLISYTNIAMFNSASEFTVSFWCKLSNYTTQTMLFEKYKDNLSEILIYPATDGYFYVEVRNGVGNYAYFKLSDYCDINVPYLFSVVYNGNEIGNNMVKLYINNVIPTTGYVGTFPSVTYNLSAYYAKLRGYTNGTDITFDEYRAINKALTFEQIKTQDDIQSGFTTNLCFDITSLQSLTNNLNFFNNRINNYE